MVQKAAASSEPLNGEFSCVAVPGRNPHTSKETAKMAEVLQSCNVFFSVYGNPLITLERKNIERASKSGSISFVTQSSLSETSSKGNSVRCYSVSVTTPQHPSIEGLAGQQRTTVKTEC